MLTTRLGKSGPEVSLATLRAVARETGTTPNQVIYAWMMQSNPPVIPLMAASNDAQMDENLRALDVVLSPDEMERLNSASA